MHSGTHWLHCPLWKVETVVGTSELTRGCRVDSSLGSAGRSLAHRQISTNTPFSSLGSKQQISLWLLHWFSSTCSVLCSQQRASPPSTPPPSLITATIYCMQVSFRENVCLLCGRLENSVTGNMIIYCPPAFYFQMFKISILCRWRVCFLTSRECWLYLGAEDKDRLAVHIFLCSQLAELAAPQLRKLRFFFFSVDF